MYNDQIVIQRAKNGWIITLPFEPPSPMDQQLNFVKQVSGMVQKQQEQDPELAKLVNQEEEPEIKKLQGKITFKPMPNVFIFPDFDEVLLFLRERVEDHKPPEQ